MLLGSLDGLNRCWLPVHTEAIPVYKQLDLEDDIRGEAEN